MAANEAEPEPAPKRQAGGKLRPVVLPAAPKGPLLIPEVVSIADINLEDTALQFRFVVNEDDLLLSIKEDGQQEPVDLVGRNPPYRIVDGFRRIGAARDLGWTSIKAVIHREITEEEAWRLSLIKNVVRKNLSRLEQVNLLSAELDDSFRIGGRRRAT